MSNNIHVKKSRPKINDGGHSAFGVNIDPNKDLCHTTNPDGSQEATYKGTGMGMDDYISSLEERYEKRSKGKDFTNIGSFSGFGPGTLNQKNKTK
jgi:hypothetical protein